MLKSLLWILGGLLVGVVIMVIVSQFIKSPEPKKTVSPQNSSPVPSATFVFDPKVPPKDSVSGLITSMDGEVKWQARLATESAEITSPQKIQQGEELETGEDGEVIVKFPESFKLEILPNSRLEFAQTLPVNLVLVQKKGSVNYQNLSEKVYSVRAKHLLVEQNLGDLSIEIDEEGSEVTVTSKNGQAKIAFNNLDNLTNVVELKEGQSYIFDDEEREGRLIR